MLYTFFDSECGDQAIGLARTCSFLYDVPVPGLHMKTRRNLLNCNYYETPAQKKKKNVFDFRHKTKRIMFRFHYNTCLIFSRPKFFSDFQVYHNLSCIYKVERNRKVGITRVVIMKTWEMIYCMRRILSVFVTMVQCEGHRIRLLPSNVEEYPRAVNFFSVVTRHTSTFVDQ